MIDSVSQALFQDLNCRPLTPFGLLIESQSSSPNLFEFATEQLREWVWKHRLIVLRGFPLFERDNLVRYCQSWGALLNWEFGFILDVIVRENPKNYLFTTGNVPFHWDGAFAKAVPSFLFFQCLRAPFPHSGGQSLFCDTTRVWQQVSPDQRELWKQIRITYRTEKLAHYGGTITQSLVSQHPHTAQTVLRFAEPLNEESVALNPLYLDVLDIPAEQHEQLLSNLKTMLYLPQNCYSHQWNDGDILIADNHALLHGRRQFLSQSPRYLQRVHIL